ncbi:arginine--tRNA ligase [Patescibacteria group bacterium]|nr:arginine--tRNA ligase [Patescibacteria group bacterium]
MKKEVVEVLKKAIQILGFEVGEEEIYKNLEVPPNLELGDCAFPCFFLAERFKESPNRIAIQIREKIGNAPLTDFEGVETQGPYINFFINRKSFAKKVVWEIINQNKNYGKSNLGKNKKVVIEFSSPNIAKPFGIGHLRSTIIGNSISNILKFRGFKVIRINYLGDWGAQFGKIIFGYKKFGSEKKIMKTPIKHLLDLYVKSSKKIYEKSTREEFRKLEKGDKKNLLIWKLFRNLSIEEFKKSYKELGIKFDFWEGESDYILKGKKVLENLKKKNLLKKSEGAYIVDLNKHNLGIALLEKSDETTLYATRDLAAAIARYKKHKFSKMIYEVGQEQVLYFKQLFKILELLGYDFSKNCVHTPHGHYLDTSGKKLATRKGKIFFVEDILKETVALAKKELLKRNPHLPEEQLERKSKKIAIAAIFYGDLKNNRTNSMIFDLEKFLSFEGNTGPYLLYSYARANSILQKAPPSKKFEVYDINLKESKLVKELSQFEEVVSRAAETLNPSVIANYAHQIAQTFNEFYHDSKVIGSKQEAFRLTLVQSFKQVLKNSLKLLEIETLEEM